MRSVRAGAGPACVLAAAFAGAAACAQDGTPVEWSRSFSSAMPEQVGMSSEALATMTDWVEHGPPILSLLVSRHGKLVYELYTSGIERAQAHYVMSVTKSVVSALVGIAIEQQLLPSVDTPVTRVLPRRLFASDDEFARFSRLTVQQVLGMAALDAPLPPRDTSPAAAARQQAFWSAPNRVAFALGQPLLTASRTAFQYNDVTPMLAIGMLQYAAGTTALQFAQQHLFGPLGCVNVEWMHQDATGLDNGGYGLRLRPIDMQRIGVLYLQRGMWNGRRLLAERWVEQSFTPWNRSQPEFAAPNYGSFWWTRRDAKWRRHEANGWQGQRIAVLPEPGLVVTMTACITDGTEEPVFAKIVDEWLPAAVRNPSGAALPAARSAQQRLASRLHEALGWKKLPDGTEPRMVPGAACKEPRVPFTDAGKDAERRR